MVMLWGFSSVITIAAFTASALWWLDGWLPCRIQFTLNAINILRRLVGCHLTRLAKSDADEKLRCFCWPSFGWHGSPLWRHMGDVVDPCRQSVFRSAWRLTGWNHSVALHSLSYPRCWRRKCCVYLDYFGAHHIFTSINWPALADFYFPLIKAWKILPIMLSPIYSAPIFASQICLSPRQNGNLINQWEVFLYEYPSFLVFTVRFSKRMKLLVSTLLTPTLPKNRSFHS